MSTTNQAPAQTQDNYFPLDGNPNVQEYTKGNISTEGLPDVIPEPDFSAPPEDFLNDPAPADSPAGEPAASPSSDPEPSFNPAFTEASAKDKKIGAELAVDTALNGYKTFCEQVLPHFAKIKEQKVEQLIADGEIDPNQPLPIDEEGNTVNIRQYINIFNPTIEDAMKVSQEFVDDVRPPLIRIFEKKGLAMTDEQYVGVAVLKDLGMKGAMLFALKSQSNQMLQMMRDQNNLLRTRAAAPVYTPEPASPPPSAPEPAPAEPAFDIIPSATAEPAFTPPETYDNIPKASTPSELIAMDQAAKRGERAAANARKQSPKKEK